MISINKKYIHITFFKNIDYFHIKIHYLEYLRIYMYINYFSFLIDIGFNIKFIISLKIIWTKRISYKII